MLFVSQLEELLYFCVVFVPGDATALLCMFLMSQVVELYVFGFQDGETAMLVHCLCPRWFDCFTLHVICVAVCGTPGLCILFVSYVMGIMYFVCCLCLSCLDSCALYVN